MVKAATETANGSVSAALALKWVEQARQRVTQHYGGHQVRHDALGAARKRSKGGVSVKCGVVPAAGQGRGESQKGSVGSLQVRIIAFR